MHWSTLHKVKGKICLLCGATIKRPSNWSPYFCIPCDNKRMARIDANMKQAAKNIGVPWKGDFVPQPEQEGDT